jgi:hypothetical protein
MNELIIQISNSCKISDLNEIDSIIRKIYKNQIKYSHINHIYSGVKESNNSEYVYGITEGTTIKIKDLISLLKFEYVIEFYILL